MRGGKGVVDVDVTERRQLRDEGRAVGLLAGVEAGVFKDQNAAVAKRRNRGFGNRPDAVAGERHRTAKDVGERRGDGAQRQFRVDAFRPPEMRQHDDLRARVGEERQRRHRRLQPRHVADVPVGHRHVEVRPDENARAANVADIVERAEH